MKTGAGKRALITGAGAGIGRCTAREFAQAGYDLVLTDINADALEDVAGELRALGAQVHTRALDVSSRAQVEELARWVIDDLGGLDVLVNNAGIGYAGELSQTPIETWERLVAVNFWGPLYHMYAFLPHMIERRSGQIANVSSGQAFFRLPTWGAYATVKAALGAVSEILQVEVRKYGVRVTTIYPFMVNTGFYKDVESKTFGQKLSMRLVPYYSMKPETVGRIVFKAVSRKKKVEMVSIINSVGSIAKALPLVGDGMALMANWFLAGGAQEKTRQESAKPSPAAQAMAS